MNIQVIVTGSYEESCGIAADMLCNVVKAKPAAKLGLATGSTPVPIYKRMAEKYAAGEVDFSQTRTVNLDEYCGIGPEHDQSYRYFMDTSLFNHINIDKANTYVASGLGDYEANCRELDAKVAEGGTPDIQLLGLGNNGHIAFNEANDFVVADSHIEQLTRSTIDANARFFAKPEDVPTQAITVGIGTILSAKKILLVASGAAKQEAMRGLLLGGEITPHNPSTFLKLHPDVTVVIDKELADLAGYKA